MNGKANSESTSVWQVLRKEDGRMVIVKTRRFAYDQKRGLARESGRRGVSAWKSSIVLIA